MLSQLTAFMGVSIFVILMPGPDVMLTIRNALRGGRAGGLFTALGVVSGLTVWTVATSAGLAALLLASAPAFMALKLAGAAYLIVLGLRGVRAMLASTDVDGPAPRAATTRRLPALLAYREGLISNLGNPKIAVFFTSLLPQFTSHGMTSFWNLLALGLLFCAMTLACLTGYVSVVSRADAVLRRSAVRRALDGFSGAVLVALGLRLATERR
jgi:threonine/homoserine/homoserine lactone efflux protein